ncbi:ABC transporter permease [Actinocatenispora sera]|uniref:ABC transporter permease n=1 Tax=Actinocatenispora sera TaxID=390989 RepID=A0A810LA44_9ACTN|nr:ABC transporter permease [Actinocatenispora sera]BCJ32117.1 ABC transporter permease [Actinocatenispora sera]
MDGNTIPVTPLLGAVLAVLALLAAAVAALGRLGVARRVLTASVRAAIQLGVVSLVIAAVLRSLWLTAAFVALMYGIATVTSARRITHDATRAAGRPGRWRVRRRRASAPVLPAPGPAGSPTDKPARPGPPGQHVPGRVERSGLWAAVPIASGLLPALAIVLGSGLVPLKGISVVPVAGILIGGAMTATSLSGRRALDELATRRGEYEAALAIGLTRRDAALEVCRPSAAQALVPALDQTRTVGLVTLPGAFVGVLLGGASPVAAGAAQLLVLVALLAVECIAVLVAVELVAAGRFRRPETPTTR